MNKFMSDYAIALGKVLEELQVELGLSDADFLQVVTANQMPDGSQQWLVSGRLRLITRITTDENAMRWEIEKIP